MTIELPAEHEGLLTGSVFNIQRFSLHDGPGIRTTVFLKGCPLRCAWCHNPESQSQEVELAVLDNRCIACGACVAACPHGAITLETGTARTDWALCERCGTCVDVCPMAGRTLLGGRMTVGDTLDEVSRDRDFYDESGGGVTFSGGEPLTQPDFLRACLEGCKRRGYHTAVDTCGFVPLEAIKAVSPWTDMFLYDVKMMDSDRHKQHTGAPNALILSNLKWLCASGKQVWVRVPLIPGVNDDQANLDALGEFVKSLPGPVPLQVLPFHTIGSHKYTRAGLPDPMVGVQPHSDEQVTKIAARLSSLGVAVSIGG